MYAIIETGGKQYKVAVGEKVKVEKLEADQGGEVVFDKIVAVKNGEGLKAGAPYVEGAKVVAEVTEQGRHKKIVVVHYKPKKNIRKKNGHRQPYTEVLVKDITL